MTLPNLLARVIAKAEVIRAVKAQKTKERVMKTKRIYPNHR